MRCGCPSCGTYMIHSEGLTLGCVCPECGVRCTDCLGTNTLVSRDQLKSLKDDPVFLAKHLRAVEDDLLQDEDDETYD